MGLLPSDIGPATRLEPVVTRPTREDVIAAVGAFVKARNAGRPAVPLLVSALVMFAQYAESDAVYSVDFDVEEVPILDPTREPGQTQINIVDLTPGGQRFCDLWAAFQDQLEIDSYPRRIANLEQVVASQQVLIQQLTRGLSALASEFRNTRAISIAKG